MATISSSVSPEKAIGSVVTFYSFKGGVGRSMALANIAVLLARAGKKVLCVDWDLEAPGLDRYFCAVPGSHPDQAPIVSPSTKPGGLLDILQHSKADRLAPWRDYLRTRMSADNQVQVDFIGSGEDLANYSTRLAKFSWPAFFAKKSGGDIIEKLRKEWKDAYDFVLVDSRTGLTDASGVCTIQMPDILVLLFAANQQNVDWCGRVAEGIRMGRRALPYDRAFLPIVPVLARFDNSESDRAAKAKARIAERFGVFFSDWLPRSIAPRGMFDWSVLPYVPRYSFEEALAVEDEPPSGALGLSFYYDLLARLILSRFQDVRAILAGVGVPGAALPPLLPSATELRNELRRDTGTVNRYRKAILERAEEAPMDSVEALETLAQAVRPVEAEALLAEAIRLLQDPALAKPEEVPRLLGLRADVLGASGRIPEAEQLYQQAIERTQTLYGDLDAHTAQIQVAFARFLAQNGRKNEAAQHCSLAVEIYDTGAIVDPLALRGALETWRDLLDELGRWPEMLLVARRVWEIVLVDEAAGLTDRVRALDRYASSLRRCGQFTKAVERYQEALKLEEESASGTATISIARALNELALALWETGRYQESELLFRRALASAEKVLGPEHPDVATAYGNLAGVLQEIGNYDEAEKLCRHALAIHEKTLGKEHPDVGMDYRYLAGVLCDTVRYGEAEILLRRALVIHEKAHGQEHPFVGIDLVYLARTLSEAGNQAEADNLWQRGLAHLEKSFGHDHNRFGRALWHYAEHLERFGRAAEAKETIGRAVAILERALGEAHPDTQRAKQTAERING